MTREMVKTGIFVLGIMMCGSLAFGDDLDPDVVQSVSATSCANTWCVAQFAGVTDPNTGVSTLEDVLTSTTVDTGWDEVVGVGGSYWLLDFEEISGGTYNGDYGMFVYCFSTTGQCSTQDAGVPPASAYTLSGGPSTSSATPNFQATTGIAGYTSNDAPNAAAQALGSTVKCTTAQACSDYYIDVTNGGHGIGSTNGGVVPEPSSVVLFGSVLLVTAGAIRRRVRNRL